jgi:hypothetical protein
MMFALAGVITAAVATPVGAYPPDNAAVLYYRAFLIYQKPEGAILDNLSAMVADGAAPTDETKKFLASQAQVVRSVTAASQIKDCDWGYDYSEGFAMLMPGLADMRNIARIVLADGMMAMQNGDCKAAAERCITVYRMARHLKNDLLISNLVGIAMESLAKSAVQQILARPAPVDVLNLLKSQLAEVADVPLENCMRMEMKCVLSQPYDKLLTDVSAATNPGEAVAAPAMDRELAEKSLAYYKERMNEYIALLGLPYTQAMARIENLHEAMEADAKAKPEAVLSQAIIPALKAAFSLQTRARTDRNALLAAIEVYLIRARTGKLPAALPANLPRDMFSGEPFEYEISDAGFTLRCRAMNLKSNKIEEYTFAVPK